MVDDEIKALFGGRPSTRVEGGESVVSSEKPLFFKELRRLWTSDEGTMFDESNTLLVENLLERFQKNPLGTGMLLPNWTAGQENDGALRPSGEVCRLLVQLSTSHDARERGRGGVGQD